MIMPLSEEIKSASLRRINQSKNSACLNFSGLGIMDDEIADLIDWVDSQCKLQTFTEIDLTQNNIGDEATKILLADTRLKHIKHLNFTNTDVGDSVALDLAKSQLSSFNLADTSFTEMGFSILAEESRQTSIGCGLKLKKYPKIHEKLKQKLNENREKQNSTQQPKNNLMFSMPNGNHSDSTKNTANDYPTKNEISAH